ELGAAPQFPLQRACERSDVRVDALAELIEGGGEAMQPIHAAVARVAAGVVLARPALTRAIESADLAALVRELRVERSRAARLQRRAVDQRGEESLDALHGADAPSRLRRPGRGSCSPYGRCDWSRRDRSAAA